MPTGRRWRNLPVPFFFHEESAAAFGALATRPDDVVLCSLAKGGTTWMHKILWCLLHGIGDDGVETVAAEGSMGSSGQVYPEALPMERPPPAEEGGDPLPEMEKVRRSFFGEGCLGDLLDQPAPRLLSTHLFGDFLPRDLTRPEGSGRLVFVLRNLKDVLVSLHWFRGEAKDGWYGNEHGPGSLKRFCAPDCPNAYGSVFRIVKEMDALVAALEATGRVIVVYFEALKLRLPEEIDRVAAFLGLPLTPAKRAAVIEAVSFGAMKSGGGLLSTSLLRKGDIGDWRNNMDVEHWAYFDSVFEEWLAGTQLAEPLRWFQRAEVGGMPLRRAEHTVEGDPRTWPEFVRVTLRDGFVVRDELIARKSAPSKTAGFQRPPSEFLGTVHPPGSNAECVAQAGRYHLFVSGVCPWASSVRAARHLMGLEQVVTMDIADGQSDGGWVFLDGVTCAPWADRPGPFYLHEVYMAGQPGCTARIVVPVLWDTHAQQIVSNDSWSIVKMFAGAFAPLGSPPHPAAMSRGLLPGDLAGEIEALHASIYKDLLNGVYRAGIALLLGNEAGAAEAAEGVYEALGSLEERLSTSRFLMGDELTAVDLRLCMTLLRYDCSHRAAFALQGGRGGVLLGEGYPALRGYARELYSLLKPAVDWSSLRQYYRWGPGHPADAALPPLAPIIASAEAPHGR